MQRERIAKTYKRDEVSEYETLRSGVQTVRSCKTLLVILAWLCVQIAVKAQSPPLQVGSQKQLFLDERFIESSKGVTLVFNQPEQPQENLLPMDRPWEQGRLGGYSVFLEDGGVYRMYYNAFEPDYETRYLCLALSTDGVHWTKPELGLIDYHGSRDNNIVALGVFGRAFIDPFDSPRRRYKMLVRIAKQDPRWAPSQDSDPNSVYLLYSADGKSWEREEKPVLPFYVGALTPVFWDDSISRWAIYPRAYLPGSRVRVYSRTTVGKHDLARPYPFQAKPGRNLGQKADRGTTARGLQDEFPFALQPDEQDPPGMQVYTFCAYKYPYAQDAYVAFPSMWYSRRPDWLTGRPDPEASDTLEMQFAFSRDGIEWKRPFRQAVVQLGPRGSGMEGQIYSGGMVRNGDRLFIYYNGLPSRHITGKPEEDWISITGRAIFRLDGFISADAAYDGGELTTPPLVFEGERLHLNAITGGGGFIRVEIQDAAGNSIPGYSVESADRVNGNSVAHAVTWKGEAAIDSLAGKTIRLRFVMRDAKLFAFQFVP